VAFSVSFTWIVFHLNHSSTGQLFPYLSIYCREEQCVSWKFVSLALYYSGYFHGGDQHFPSNHVHKCKHWVVSGVDIPIWGRPKPTDGTLGLIGTIIVVIQLDSFSKIGSFSILTFLVVNLLLCWKFACCSISTAAICPHLQICHRKEQTDLRRGFYFWKFIFL
jgi:hypothetical protein